MQMGEITITEAYVEEKVGKIVADKDLSQYILQSEYFSDTQKCFLGDF